MARKANLRAVAADEKPAKPEKPKSLEEAANSGSDLDFLKVALRDMIRDRQDMTGPAKAAIYRQIIQTRKDITALEAAADQEAAEDGEVEDEAFDASAI